jgi:hypothetical protein
MVKDYLKNMPSLNLNKAIWIRPTSAYISRGYHWAQHFCGYGFWDGASYGIRSSEMSVRCKNQCDELRIFVGNVISYKLLEVKNSSEYSDEQQKMLSEGWEKLANYYRPLWHK